MAFRVAAAHALWFILCSTMASGEIPWENHGLPVPVNGPGPGPDSRQPEPGGFVGWLVSIASDACHGVAAVDGWGKRCREASLGVS